MSLPPDLLQLSAFVDGELELTRQLEIEAQAAADPALRAQLERLRAQREALRRQADYHPAPTALQAKLRQRLAAEAGVLAPPPVEPVLTGRRRWFAWAAFASGMAAVAVVLATVQWIWLPQREDERVQEEVIASHSRAVLSQRLVDVASSDHHTVKPWLSARLDFSPPVEEPAGLATQLLGARIDYLAGRPVAVLVLRHAGHTAESYVWPVQGGDREVALARERGFQVARWTRGGMRHWLISDVNPAEFARLVRELRGG